MYVYAGWFVHSWRYLYLRSVYVSSKIPSFHWPFRDKQKCQTSWVEHRFCINLGNTSVSIAIVRPLLDRLDQTTLYYHLHWSTSLASDLHCAIYTDRPLLQEISIARSPLIALPGKQSPLPDLYWSTSLACDLHLSTSLVTDLYCKISTDRPPLQAISIARSPLIDLLCKRSPCSISN